MLDLRLVEIDGDRKEIQLIQKFPATIGKAVNRRIPPPYHTTTLIPNPLVSGFHCTVTFDIRSEVWAVTDGVEGVASTNGLYGQAEGGGLIVGAGFVLRRSGDRVYLINVTDGRQVYLEVYNATADLSNPNDTQGLDPSLVEFKESIELKIAEGVQRGEGRDRRLDEATKKIAAIESAALVTRRVLTDIDKNSGKMIRGAFVAAIVSGLCVPTLLLLLAVMNGNELAKVLLDLIPHGGHSTHQDKK